MEARSDAQRGTQNKAIRAGIKEAPIDLVRPLVPAPPSLFQEGSNCGDEELPGEIAALFHFQERPLLPIFSDSSLEIKATHSLLTQVLLQAQQRVASCLAR